MQAGDSLLMVLKPEVRAIAALLISLVNARSAALMLLLLGFLGVGAAYLPLPSFGCLRALVRKGKELHG